MSCVPIDMADAKPPECCARRAFTFSGPVCSSALSHVSFFAGSPHRDSSQGNRLFTACSVLLKDDDLCAADRRLGTPTGHLPQRTGQGRVMTPLKISESALAFQTHREATPCCKPTLMIAPSATGCA